MTCEIVQINPNYPQPRRIAKAIEILSDDGVIAFPTDSTYGIGCNLYSKTAIDRLYTIRNRNPNKPFTFLCADLSDLSKYANVPNQSFKLMKQLTPGPYTFILNATQLVPKIMRTTRYTVGIRVPDHPVCNALLVALGNPIISTTARAGTEFFADPWEIKDAFGERLDLIIDAEYIYPQQTTVLDLTGDDVRLVRAGKGEWNE